MFSTHKWESNKPVHYNKPFHKISISPDSSDNTPVLMLEDKIGIYYFDDLSEQEVKNLSQAIQLNKKASELEEKNLATAMHLSQQSESLILKFLLSRHHRGDEDAHEVNELLKNNSYYRKKLDIHSEKEPKAKKQKLCPQKLNPSKRKSLTENYRTSEDIPNLFALDEQLLRNDPSQMYDESSQAEDSTSTSNNLGEQESKRTKGENSNSSVSSKKSHSGFFKPAQESKSSNNNDQAPVPLTKRQVGGIFAWDDLQKTFVFATVHPPLVSHRVSQEDCETTSPQKRKRKR